MRARNWGLFLLFLPLGKDKHEGVGLKEGKGRKGSEEGTGEQGLQEGSRDRKRYLDFQSLIFLLLGLERVIFNMFIFSVTNLRVNSTNPDL